LTNSGKTFNGWNTAANGSGTGYAAGSGFTVNADTNLYAQWISAPLTPPGATLAEKFAYIAGRGDDGTVYDIPIDADEDLSPVTLSTLGRNVTINLYSTDPENIKSIQLTSAGALFTVNTNITLQLSNITLKGMSPNTNALVEVYQGGTLIVNSGTKISFNRQEEDRRATGGGGVYLEAATMVMNGGEITENRVEGWSGGGIAVYKGSTLTLKDGVIANNEASYQWGTGNGGGIGVESKSTVLMNGGSIYGNTAMYHGGGVVVSADSTFTKRPAAGTTTSGIIYGSSGDMANVAGASGATMFRDNGNKKVINRTLGQFDEITSLTEEGWEQ
jgi:hypothetical protein